MTRTLILSLLAQAALFSLPAQAVITSLYDHDRDCHRYSVIQHVRNDEGDFVLERELADGEEIVSTRVHYGLSTSNLQVDFDQRVAQVELIANVTLGVNRNLLERDKFVSIEENHPQFSEIVNSLNRRIFLFDQVCVRGDKIIYIESND